MTDLAAIIAEAAARRGVEPGALMRVAQLESTMNPNAQNPRSSAGGLFQFVDKTAAQYGLTDRFDPVQAADAAARLMADNQRFLTSRLGRPPTPAELYLAHQQGAGGAAALLSNPNAPAAQIVGERAVTLNGGTPDMTAGQFAAMWLQRAERRGGGGPRPTVPRGPGQPGPGQNSALAALLAQPDQLVIPEAERQTQGGDTGRRAPSVAPRQVQVWAAPMPAQALITPDMLVAPEAPMSPLAAMFEAPMEDPTMVAAQPAPAPAPRRSRRG